MGRLELILLEGGGKRYRQIPHQCVETELNLVDTGKSGNYTKGIDGGFIYAALATGFLLDGEEVVSVELQPIRTNVRLFAVY